MWSMFYQYRNQAGKKITSRDCALYVIISSYSSSFQYNLHFSWSNNAMSDSFDTTAHQPVDH